MAELILLVTDKTAVSKQVIFKTVHSKIKLAPIRLRLHLRVLVESVNECINI